MFLRMSLMALLFTACTGHFKTPSDTLVVALSSQPATLDPRFATDATGVRIGGLIFESLTRVGPGFTAQPQVATSWKLQDHTYTFQLRTDLKFNNGRKVTAQDLLFSFDFYRGSKSPFASTLSIIEDVQVKEETDHLVLKIKVKRPSEKFLISDLPAVKILPQQEIQSSPSNFSRRLIGTGPYRYLKTDLNEIRLASDKAKVPFLTFKVIRDDYTRFQKLLKGEVDFALAEIPPERVQDFEKRSEQFQVWRFPGLSMTYVLINFKNPLLKQKAVRRALAQSLQRQDVIHFKLSGMAREATSLLTPENPFALKALKNLEFNPDAARAEMDKLDLTGKHLTLKTSNSPQAIDTGKVLANQFSRSGLKIDLESYEWATFYSDVKKGNFELATMKWVGLVDPDIYQLAFDSKELPPGRNRGSYMNAQVDSELKLARLSTSKAERRQHYDRVQSLVHEDLAILPLWYDEQVAIAQKNVLNFKPSLASDYLPLVDVAKQE